MSAADQSATQGTAELTESNARRDMLLLCLIDRNFHGLIQLWSRSQDNEGMSIPRSTATGQRAVWPFGWVTAATLVVNVLSYVLHVVATNSLGPAGYGQFAALLAVQVVATVPALALQTVVAREIVRGTDVAALRRVVRQLALILVGVAAVATVLLSIFFKQWPWWVTAAAFVAVPVLAGMSGELGIIQGSERFGRFGWALLGTGIGKFVPPTLVFVFLTRASTPSGTLSASEQVASHVVTAAFVALAAGCAVAWAGLRLWNRTTEATASTDPAVSTPYQQFCCRCGPCCGLPRNC